MSINRDLIERFIDAMNRHDVDGLQGCYTSDACIVYPGREAQTPEAYAAGERAMLESVPDYHIEATSILEAGDHVVVELRMSGTQGHDLGGRSFTFTGAYIFRLAGGLIAEEHAYPDIAGLRRQLAPR